VIQQKLYIATPQLQPFTAR